MLEPNLDHRQGIQEAAYYLWLERGCPWGTPEVDWFSAEQQLHKPAVIAVAEAVGSVLGTSVTTFKKYISSVIG